MVFAFLHQFPKNQTEPQTGACIPAQGDRPRRTRRAVSLPDAFQLSNRQQRLGRGNFSRMFEQFMGRGVPRYRRRGDRRLCGRSGGGMIPPADVSPFAGGAVRWVCCFNRRAAETSDLS